MLGLKKHGSNQQIADFNIRDKFLQLLYDLLYNLALQRANQNFEGIVHFTREACFILIGQIDEDVRQEVLAVINQSIKIKNKLNDTLSSNTFDDEFIQVQKEDSMQIQTNLDYAYQKLYFELMEKGIITGKIALKKSKQLEDKNG